MLAGCDRRCQDLLRFAEGDEDVGGLDVQVGELLLVQVLQTAGHLVGSILSTMTKSQEHRRSMNNDRVK